MQFYAQNIRVNSNNVQEICKNMHIYIYDIDCNTMYLSNMKKYAVKICRNMQFYICKIFRSLYFAYFTFICTPYFADVIKITEHNLAVP